MFSSKKKGMDTAIINTIIGDNSRIEGQLIVSESTRVDGLLHGKLLSKSKVIIGEHGVIKGDIKGIEILVAGTVYGNIQAEEKIEITATGQVLGDIFTKSLVIDEGASFKGNCSMEVLREPQEEAGELGADAEIPEVLEAEEDEKKVPASAREDDWQDKPAEMTRGKDRARKKKTDGEGKDLTDEVEKI